MRSNLTWILTSVGFVVSGLVGLPPRHATAVTTEQTEPIRTQHSKNAESPDKDWVAEAPVLEANPTSESIAVPQLMAKAPLDSTPQLPSQTYAATDLSPTDLNPTDSSPIPTELSHGDPASDPLILAQVEPQQNLPIPEPSSPPEEEPVLPPVIPDKPPADSSSIPFPVSDIQILGSSIFDDSDFEDIVQPFEGRDVTLAELRGVADAVTQLYLNEGYITSRAILGDQTITDGVVRIQVVEGRLAAIEIEGNKRLNRSYIRDRVALGAKTPLSQIDLEQQLRLLRADPLFDNVEASLRAGDALGESILIVRVDEADPFGGNVFFDNYSPPSVGSSRLGTNLRYRNLTGLGDELGASFYRSLTGGSNVFDFNYRIPVNPMNGTFRVRFAPSDFKITSDEASGGLDIDGSSDIYEASFRQPLVRTTREEFALSFGFTHRSGETLISDITVDSSKTSVFRFSQDYVRRDVKGAWAFQSQFNIGTGLFDASTDSVPADALFFSWLGQAQRVQILGDDHLLIVQADLQLTPDPLLSSQQFVMGGGQSLRGYRQNLRSGDNGFRLSVEDRITLDRDAAGQPTLQVAPFLDMGAVWNDVDNVDLPVGNENFLIAVGIGVLHEVKPGLDLRADFGVPLIDANDRGENLQDYGLTFSLNYTF